MVLRQTCILSALLLNTLDWPCPRIQHSPPHHHRVNLGNLPGDAGLRLVQDGRARAVDPGLPEVEVEAGRGQGAPQAPSPDHCIPKLVVQNLDSRYLMSAPEKGLI